MVIKNILVIRKPKWGVPIGLKNLGYNVTQLNFVDYIDNHGRDKFFSYLLSKCKAYDVVIVCKGGWKGAKYNFTTDALKELTRRTFTVFWMHDAILNSSRYIFSRMAACCSLASSPYLCTCRAFKKFGQNNIQQIFQGFEEEWCYKREMEKIYDVSFFGKLYGDRKKYINFLKTNKVSVFREKCSFLQSSINYNQSKICLNLVPGECFSNRSMRIMGSGGFLLSQMNQDLNRAFKDGKELSLWKTKEELLEKVTYFLDHEKEREEIANNGYKAIQNFSWTNQMRKLIRAINGETIRDGAF